jgi:hypothetical protein
MEKSEPLYAYNTTASGKMVLLLWKSLAILLFVLCSLNSGPCTCEACCTGALPLETLHQPCFLCWLSSKIGSHELFARGWYRTVIILISASWAASITGHQRPAEFFKRLNRVTKRPSNSIPRYIPKKNEIIHPCRTFYLYNCSQQHYSWQPIIIQMSIIWWIYPTKMCHSHKVGYSAI